MWFIFQVKATAQPLQPTNDASDLSPTSTYSLVGLHTGSTETRSNTLPESLYAQVQMSARSWNNSAGIPHTALAATSSLYLSFAQAGDTARTHTPPSPCTECIPADILRSLWPALERLFPYTNIWTETAVKQWGNATKHHTYSEGCVCISRYWAESFRI